MLRCAQRRILQAVPLLFLVTVICFALMQAAPYDAVDAVTTPDMSPETVERLREDYGLRESVPTQYLRWMGNILRGNLGYSLVNHTDIRHDLRERSFASLMLTLPAYTAAVVLSLAFGLLAAQKRGSRIGRMIDDVCAVLVATPSFWLGLLLLYFGGYRLHLFPIFGMYSAGEERSFGALARHCLLPGLTLLLGFIPDLTWYVRANAVRELQEEYCLTQTVFGASRGEILWKGVLPNIMTSVVTKIGMSIPGLLTGYVAVENVFGWPGIGSYFVKAVRTMDYPVVLILLLISSGLVILGNLLADLLCLLIDPRTGRSGA